MPPRKPQAKNPTRKTARKPPGGSISASILSLTTTTPATPPEIAESLNTSYQHVHQTLKRYGIEPNTVDSFKKNRAEIFAGLQDKILKTIEIDDLKEASVLQKVTAAGILYDKERLETNKSTANIGVLISQIESIQEADACG